MAIFVSYLGSFFAGPEMMVAPAMLLWFGVVGNASKRGSQMIGVTISMLLMVALWVSGFVGL